MGMKLKLLAKSLPALAFLLFAGASPAWAETRAAYLEQIRKAEALFKEKCSTVAGVRIYKTVPEVEGVLLLKMRPEPTDRELADRLWPGAAFGREFSGDSYIRSFLGYEYPATGPISPSHRGYINTDKRPGGLPGYRWVEVIDPKDGQRYRYSGSVKIVGRKDTTAFNVQLELKKNPNLDLNVYRWSLDRSPAPKDPPRYGVTFEDHVIPEERALWLASSTVRVLDLKTNEVLGEMTRYAMSYIHQARDSMPWLNHSTCPDLGTTGDSTTTRHFVDQVLLPKKQD